MGLVSRSTRTVRSASARALASPGRDIAGPPTPMTTGSRCPMRATKLAASV
jgi:hypothetical protein